ncbi:pimeloyl-ACP methyl ester carboxylesterase [Lewinella marina]|uniref:Alpha/beta hydrolase n=1 Tax=Neolewinella marina TaxID=438751 RepID=A0A2G0CH50_9BACT|nr:alpha/beta hydrolase [Neolewinella marina]NJB86281.1 pimeloyl-ACP methyl ester carboxylesterase [Neolewinella marina]PHK99247.1 alpha/beta hydrolase [Neolewinella marina]
MLFIKTTDQASGKEIKLRYQEYGSGKPVVFIHGWPLNGDMYEYQLEPLSREGLRCIAYDRRGFGHSSRVGESYHYDAFADDLHAVLTELDLHDATLVGFSMGGGEIARYIGKYGEDRVSAAILISAVTPYMLETDGHDGVNWKIFQGMIDGLRKDRPHFLASWAKNFYGVGLLNHPVSDEFLSWTLGMALLGSSRATIDCVTAFGKTDFRQDLKKFTVPTLIIHGEDDKIVPAEVGGDATHEVLPNAIYHKYDNAPHGLFYTHRERLNRDILSFVMTKASVDRNIPVR